MTDDIICPGCGEIINFKNIMQFDDEQIRIEGLAYALRCLKCDTMFFTPLRMSTEMTKAQKDDLAKMLEKIKSEK